MRTVRISLAAVAAVALVSWLTTSLTRVEARRAPVPAPPSIDADDIGGVVTSAKGAEAGVWVIAETSGLATGFRKIVVTDDEGRYVIPDLPKATYNVWVRGYGLVDSKPVETMPGKSLNLTAVIAPSPRAAAQYYPADYWFSLMQVPPKSAFPMEKEGIQTQLQWISAMKSAVQLFQVGDKATRVLPEQLGKFNSSLEAMEAWAKTGEGPLNGFVEGRLDRELVVKMYADWVDRIAAGEIPQAPPRPQGVERNVVISEWDWASDKAFIHDVTASDQRNPTRDPNGPIYGVEQFSADVMDILDPMASRWTSIDIPMRDPSMKGNYAEIVTKGPAAPLTWGNENVRPAKMRLHNTAMDQKGRIWITGRFRKPEDQPEFCKTGSSQPSAKFYPINRNNALSLQVELYDPEMRKIKMIDTCYGTMHLVFGEDADNTLWFSGGSQVIGWLNTKVYDETGDEAKAQGWCPYILDTNGNGKVDEYVGPDDPVDPTKDKRIRGGSYGIGYSAADGSIWEGVDQYPGFILRISPGSNPPYTCLTEIYNSPPGTSNPKGVYVDRSTGVVWVAFAGSGTFGKFDRRKCKVLNGPTATGNQCPEGWTLYPSPGPKFKNVTDAFNTDWHYLNWVDQFDTLGLGRNIPLAPGTNSDSMVALLPGSGKFVVLRVPYPLGFYSRGMDGRIDDPNAGWKGRGLWSNYASISPWNMEGGKGETPKAVKFQIRPDPLAD